MESSESIKNTFQMRFERVFSNKHPKLFDVFRVFNWLESEGKNAKSFEAINTLDQLRRVSETHFCQFSNLREKAEKKSGQVNKILRKMSEKLREKKSSLEVTMRGIRREKEKEPPPE